jgi:hypothetical protein
MRAFLWGAGAVLALAIAVPALSQAGRPQTPGPLASAPQADLLAIDPEVASAETSMSNRGLVTLLADRLQALYVDADHGLEYADALRAYAAVGNYDRVSGQPLADLLNADLQVLHRDPRLFVRSAAPSDIVTSPAPAPAIAAVEGERWVMPGVAYLRINQFAGTRESLAAIDRFMAGHTAARALVFDLRRATGGSLAAVDRILPWLYAAPTRLAIVTVRADAAAPNALVTIPDLTSLRRVGGLPGIVTHEHWVTPLGDGRLRQARVLVLVSHQTRSAAEHLAAVLQVSGRASVIGEPTAGIDHLGGSVALANGFSVWVPVGRTVSAGTSKDWEATGVTPDLAVPADEALRAALVREGTDPARAARLATEAEAVPTTVAPAPNAGRDAARARIISEFSRPASPDTPRP